MSFSLSQLHYMQRTSWSIPDLAESPEAVDAPVALRRLWRIRGTGITEKLVRRDARSDAAVHMPTLDFLIGLYAFRIPIAFRVESEADRLSVSIGTFLRRGQTASDAQAGKILSDRQQIIKSALNGTLRSIDLQAADPQTAPSTAVGLAIGIPTVKAPDPVDGALPIDRLVRALRGTSWGCLVLAEPIEAPDTSALRSGALEDLKTLQLYLENTKYPDPLSRHYAQLLEATVDDYTYGLAIGAWRTSVYLTGDDVGYMRLGAVWQGIFSGDRSLHMPMSIRRQPRGSEFVAHWKISDRQAPAGPAKFHHRYAHQTVLTSDQLAAYIHLPQIETSGFRILLNPIFDTVPAELPDNAAPIHLGRVMQGARETHVDFDVSVQGLSKHTLISGVTGSGKTNTLLQLLGAADQAGVPFLVIEPAKTEYRALLNHPALGPKLRIFTLGNENVAPFRLNPFECLPGTPVAAHIDMLRSAFGAGFGMWTPLPQVLEQCLHEIYVDRGWDLSADRNSRTGDRTDPLAFPTLTELLHKVDEITPRLGYDDKIASDIRAALRTRINGLRAGGKGRMLDTRRSISPEHLFGRPVILELEQIGDEDDKAFVIGLLLIRVWEYRRLQGRSDALRHLLVVEEAHRLLSNVVPRAGQEEANARGKAVESFTNLLAEVRAYGQGVIIADQSPTRLAADVVKNTDLKIAHRVVAQEDRTTLMGAMAMNEPQSRALSTLGPGVAAVFREGEDAPLLIKVRDAKSQLGAAWPSDEAVATHRGEVEEIAAHAGCAANRQTQNACELARELSESDEFQRSLTRLVVSAFEPVEVLTGLWAAMAARIQAVRRHGMDDRVLVQCAIARASWAYADARGAASGWSFRDTGRFAMLLTDVLADLARGGDGKLDAFRSLLVELSVRTYDPFSHCAQVCPDQPATCLYRHAVTQVLRLSSVRRAWERAEAEDLGESGRANTIIALEDAADLIAYRGPGGTSRAHLQATLCCGQQLLAADPERLQETREIAMSNIVLAAVGAADQPA
jgi:DNA helicase HerA-like ATPase